MKHLVAFLVASVEMGLFFAILFVFLGKSPLRDRKDWALFIALWLIYFANAEVWID